MADSGASPPPSSLHAGTDHVPPQPRLHHPSHANNDDKRLPRAAHRSHKHRSSGAFLLPDAIRPDSSAPERIHPHRRHRTAAEHRIATSGAATPEKIQSSGAPNGSHALTPESASKRSARTSETISGAAAAQRDSLTDATTLDGSERSSAAAPLDVDSAQIVNMALNLSESRRLAARRNISSPLPPRLAPLPDSAAGGSLRQHLQQQRRASRNISPKPGAPARSASGQNVASPLKPSFDQEGSYRYHFSPSTLSRAQKAKEYLELQAQYRRVLELLPPLTPESTGLSSNPSPYGSPMTSNNVSRATTRSFDPDRLGRAYNPLQYIRNRKVRARERKTIDGEAQGFADVPRVTEWVDEAARSVASGHVAESGSTLPPFNTPEELASQVAGTQPVVTAAKSKRPRVDWMIDPADMLADVYWLEQGTNKNMVEDRDGRRVFAQDSSSLYQPVSRLQAGDRSTLPAPSSSLQDSTGLRVETDPTGLEQKTSKGENEHMFGSARERAQQKLQAIRGLHHRHNSSINHRHHDFLHSRNGSLSDSSDDDCDRKGRNRGETIGSSGKEILEKQMMEMIAQEQREKELEARLGPEAGRQRSLTVESVAPEGDSVVHSTAPSRAPSIRREQPAAEANGTVAEPQKPKQLPVSPIRSARASLEVPSSGRRLSIDNDTSHPASPELRSVRGTVLVPAIGKDWSPRPSRPSSPSRNPLAKVKSIFRDRSRERNALADERRGSADIANPAVDSAPDTPKDKARKGEESPVRKVISRGSDSSNRSPRTYGSLRLRGDDSYGLRGLLKAPRIDSVLRSGVSRVSDLIWRKDPATAASADSSSSSDESDTEPASRGRSRETPAAQPDQSGAKTSYLDVMPSFVSQSHIRPPPGDQTLLNPPVPPPSRPLSRKSSRFELLKPPKIDVQDTSSSPTNPLLGPAQKVRSHTGSDTTSGAESSRKSSNAGAVRGAADSLNAAISTTSKHPRRPSSATQRHWSVSDRRPSQAQASAVVSRAEIARLRALVLSSGIMAKEIDRRARERRPPGDRSLVVFSPCYPSRRPSSTPSQSPTAISPPATAGGAGPTWTSITALHPDPGARAALLAQPLSQAESFPAAARALAAAIERAGTAWQAATSSFSAETAPRLRRRAESARRGVAGRLSDATRRAADEADEVSLDLAQGQRLKVKRVVDVMDKMLRRRRRRFRWLRRGMWLGVEWVLVGFMWYVWFVVVIARMVLGVGKGVVRGVRWLLWL